MRSPAATDMIMRAFDRSQLHGFGKAGQAKPTSPPIVSSAGPFTAATTPVLAPNETESVTGRLRGLVDGMHRLRQAATKLRAYAAGQNAAARLRADEIDVAVAELVRRAKERSASSSSNRVGRAQLIEVADKIDMFLRDIEKDRTTTTIEASTS